MAEEEAANEGNTAWGSTTATKPRSKNGVPRTGLQTVDEFAQKIWTAARRSEVAPEVVARALSGKSDTKASGGGWRARLTPLRLFRVVESGKDGKLKLTELGVALANVADHEGRAQALKTAALNIPAYETILTRYDGGELPALTPIKSEFEFGWDMSATDATAAAELFIEGAKYAGLVGEDGVVRLNGAHPDPAPAAEDPELELADDEEVEDADEQDSGSSGADEEPLPDREASIPPPADVKQGQAPHPPEPAPASAPPVGLNVKLDMSAWAVVDVLRVLAVLGFEAPRGPE